MKQMQQTVLDIIAANAPLSESAIGIHMPGVHNEIISGCLRRLREKQHIDRSDGGLWSVKDAPPPAPLQQEIAVSETKKETKTCPRCKETKAAKEFHGNGYCAPCGRAKSAEYAAKRKGTPVPPPITVTQKMKGKRVAGVPILMNGERMVIMQFAIRVEDSSGVVHDLFLTGDVVKRLAIELQEYA